jgi:hypothetical protein
MTTSLQPEGSSISLIPERWTVSDIILAPLEEHVLTTAGTTNTALRPCSEDYLISLFVVYRQAQVLSDMPDGCNNEPPKNPRCKVPSDEIPLDEIPLDEIPLDKIPSFNRTMTKSPYTSTAIAAKFCTEPIRKILKYNLDSQTMGRVMTSISEIRTTTSSDRVSIQAQERDGAFSLARSVGEAMNARSVTKDEFINRIKDMAWNVSMKKQTVSDMVDASEEELSPICPPCLTLESRARDSISLLLPALCRITATPRLVPRAFFAMLSLLDSPHDPFGAALIKYSRKASSVDVKHRYSTSHRASFMQDNTKDNRPWEQFLKNGAPGFPPQLPAAFLPPAPFLIPGLISQMVPAAGTRLVRCVRDEYLEFLEYIQQVCRTR